MVHNSRSHAKPVKANSARITPNPVEQLPSSRHLKWFLTVLLAYFGLRLLFYAITVSPYVPPDENTHVGVSRIFSTVPFLPENSPETYQYGLVTNIPYLYYWTMGKLLTVNFFNMPDLLFLRLLNIPFAFGTVYFSWRTLRLLTDDRLSQLLLIVATTNTIMFSFLSAFVSYDNLTNLLAAAAVYHLLAFLKNRSGDLLAISLLYLLAGSLTKVSFLPLVLILTMLLFIHEAKNIRLLPGVLSGYFKTAGWRQWGFAICILLGLALNIQHYGGNYLHYGNLAPEMFDVLSPDKAMQNRLAARSLIFFQFKEGRISRAEALAMTSQINHPGDRADAIYLIENYDALKSSKTELLGPLDYLIFWVPQMAAGIFGIFGHIQMANRGPTIWPFAVLGMLTILGILFRWRPGEAGWLSSCLMAIAVFYGLFLLYFVNYSGYLDCGALGIALQGRYIFPVLGPIYVISSFYLPHLFRNERLRLGVSSAACIIFIASDFPYFLLHATPEWFRPLFS